MKLNNLAIIVRRWFQKTYGNTYHSVIVYANSEVIGREHFRYGYGDAWKQTAMEILQNANLWPRTNQRLKSGIGKDFYDFLGYLKENKDNIIIEVVNVNRKKDL